MKPAKESFRQGWCEMLKSEVLPVAELWEGITNASIQPRAHTGNHARFEQAMAEAEPPPYDALD